jgi:thiol:disulfide interchange protein DsbD
MRRFGAYLLAVLFCLAVLTARAAHTQATLVLSADTAKPGDTVWIGVDLKMEPGWHTYWKNPGEAGMPTKIAWQLPPGVTAGDIQWPLPEKLPPADVTTYGYSDEVMLLVPLKIGTNVPTGPITLTANLSWLECKDVCIPGKTTIEATLNIGDETKQSANAAAIESWKAKVPAALDEAQWTVHAWWETQASGDTRPLIIQFYQPASAKRLRSELPDFFPYASENYDIQPATGTIPLKNWGFDLRKSVKKFSGDWPTEISGVITIKQNGQRSGIEIQVPISNEAPANETASTPETSETNAIATPISNPPSPANQTSTATLLKFLLFAFIGGLILNVMPCVLPVIALKILGFVSEARSEPRRVRNLGFIYALGVLASFSALAALVIGINAAGHRAGWGMQFGNPVFVVCMTTLITLVALNLFGVFEVIPGGKVMDAAGNLASRHGAAGAFFNGLLATILATPCTAPYMATALGFAFSQSAVVIFLILLFVGLGLAAPYVVLSCNPALLKFLPKPGPWMEKFKIAMGFPMLATVIWLLGIAASDYGERVIWLSVFLVVLAFTAWIFGEFVQRGRKGRGLAIAIVVVLLIANYAYALESRLRWREMTETDATASLSANGVIWNPWSPEAVAEARSAGKPVLVDFTATWCVTCNAIVKPALETQSVVDKLKELNATTLLGDYTRTPQNMTDEIAKYGSAGVPLVLVYPKNPNAPAIVVRQPGPLELPSAYSKAVLDALTKAGE